VGEFLLFLAIVIGRFLGPAPDPWFRFAEELIEFKIEYNYIFCTYSVREFLLLPEKEAKSVVLLRRSEFLPGPWRFQDLYARAQLIQ
jgi:hypothetical protein